MIMRRIHIASSRIVEGLVEEAKEPWQNQLSVDSVRCGFEKQ